MQFNSVTFIFYFLPVFLAVYYLTPRRARSAALTVGSIVFYGLSTGWEPVALGALLVCLAWTYATGLILEKHRSLWLLWLAVLPMAGALAFFKLYRGGELLPAGMSFYVFAVIAVLVNIYKGRLEVRGSGLMLAAEVTMFPKLMSGPIADPPTLRRQSKRPHRTAYTFHLGLQQLILGLGLKVILAGRVGGAWSMAGTVGFESVSTPFLWMALLSWCMRLYFDFYGYSLMAVGLGHMLGFHLPMNFLEPYSSKTVSEFFRRWHATLGMWFREYVYIPLGGNRRGTARTVFNLAVVWALTGLWHGTGGAYLMWAAILWAFIVSERLLTRKYLERTRVLCHIYVVAVIILSWVPFAAGNVGEALTVYGRLFGMGQGMGGINDFLTTWRQYTPLMAAGVFFATPIPGKLWLRVKDSLWADAALFVLFIACAYFMATSAQDPFLYFDF